MSEQLTCLIYELLDAHDDTARIAPTSLLDAAWAAHLDYLRVFSGWDASCLRQRRQTSTPKRPAGGWTTSERTASA
jgi:hypothetical protein